MMVELVCIPGQPVHLLAYQTSCVTPLLASGISVAPYCTRLHTTPLSLLHHTQYEALPKDIVLHGDGDCLIGRTDKDPREGRPQTKINMVSCSACACYSYIPVMSNWPLLTACRLWSNI
jgi:hypothetical protein